MILVRLCVLIMPVAENEMICVFAATGLILKAANRHIVICSLSFSAEIRRQNPFGLLVPTMN